MSQLVIVNTLEFAFGKINPLVSFIKRPEHPGVLFVSTPCWIAWITFIGTFLFLFFFGWDLQPPLNLNSALSEVGLSISL